MADEQDRYKDFDAADEAEKPVRFNAKGREYVLLGDPPAKPILKMMKEGRLTSEQSTHEVLESLIGKDNLQQLLEDGIGIGKMVKIAEWLLVEYDLLPRTGEEEDGGGVERPQSASMTSSANGRVSRRTSVATT